MADETSLPMETTFRGGPRDPQDEDEDVIILGPQPEETPLEYIEIPIPGAMKDAIKAEFAKDISFKPQRLVWLDYILDTISSNGVVRYVTSKIKVHWDGLTFWYEWMGPAPEGVRSSWSLNSSAFV